MSQATQTNTSFTFQTIIAGEKGETLQHLGARNLLWHVGGAIARHPVTNGYGLTKEQISEGGEIAFAPDDQAKPQHADLGTLVDGFNYLTQTLEELSEFEDYDTRTGAPTQPFAWYEIPSLEFYIRNFQAYKAGRVNTTRQDQAKALGIKVTVPLIDVSTEVTELVANAMAEIKGVSDFGTFEDLQTAIAELKIDPLYIIHQSAVGMLDRAKASLMAGKAGYIDPEILAFARWTCRPQQGMQAPQD
jgi:hypothetical protein